MLDPSHPRYPVILRARTFVDVLLSSAKAMTLLPESALRQQLLRQCEVELSEMAEFNEQFYGSKLYISGLHDLQTNLRVLADKSLRFIDKPNHCPACGSKVTCFEHFGEAHSYCDACLENVMVGIDKLERVVEYGEG